MSPPPTSRGWQDELIEQMPPGFDEAQIRENLRRTPAERLERALTFRRQVEEMREAFGKRPQRAG